MNKSNENLKRLITNEDVKDVFTGFKNDKERIKYVSRAYKNMNLAKAFGVFYGMEVSNELKQNKSINVVNKIELGQVYSGTVKVIDKGYISFDVPGVKEEIFSKENFNDCIDMVNAYLATHNNKLLFEVRAYKDNRYEVSVIQGYYRAWADKINNAIAQRNGINVHIDELVKGGYVCHTNIDELNVLTGRNYTHSVFIPGSQIVLNIERDFEKWVGQDVIVVPQKFMDFQTVGYGPSQLIEKSLVSSRKLVLQILGMKNMYEIYNNAMTREKLAKEVGAKVEDVLFEGTVTGIINSANKTGVFVELKDKYITGLANLDSSDLLNFPPGTEVKVRIKEFEIQEGKEPFTLNKKGTSLIKCNTRAVFEIV